MTSTTPTAYGTRTNSKEPDSTPRRDPDGRRRPARAAVLTVAAVTLGLALSACGNNGSSTGTAAAATAASPAMSGMDHSAGHGATAAPVTGEALDRAFLSGMVPHHQAAVDMAKVEVARGTDAKVQALARKIVGAQDKEIATMNRIASASYSFTPMTSHSGPMGEIMGVALSMDMSMMGQELAQAAYVDRTFLEMMIPHHASAITMADEEVSSGANAELKTLATSIVADQAREIGEMQQLRENL